MQRAIRTPAGLAAAVGIALEDLPYSQIADQGFPLLVPHAFAARIERGNVADPLLRQILAAQDETLTVAGYSNDPLAETSLYAGTPGLLQKYHGRALLVVTGQCAINCRYCFRRDYPYSDNAQSSTERLATIDQLLDDSSIGEIILSGGDPLLLLDEQITAIAQRIARHERDITLRIHTRLPIVIPDRVTTALTRTLSQTGLRSVMVLHSNHPNEIDQATAKAIQSLRDAGVTMLNQSVLLAGVNDNPDVLAALSDRLFAAGVLPYYIHMLDKVAGSSHFEVCEDSARRIMGELSALRPGYLIPKLAVERPGAASKRQLEPIYPSV
ncbi:EF-P beta-lysylation protein EpmB [Congregibacter variabilis]|uniref:L-lysine 2,3-aminomutase n=1 Tax=Congregibacter variabilis TaxID=3081200 RepID=A0ABZ0I0U3_9GAMM|nr:EF-P beta-lysylation protein EpmB [Congregibacter sp. IMCC43200]